MQKSVGGWGTRKSSTMFTQCIAFHLEIFLFICIASGMQINYYYPILNACVPPPQHVRSTKLWKSEIKDLTFGAKSSNFGKYFHVQKLATKNMTSGINNWSIFYNIDYLLVNK